MENSNSENYQLGLIQRFLLELFENYVDGISAGNKLSTPKKNDINSQIKNIQFNQTNYLYENNL